MHSSIVVNVRWVYYWMSHRIPVFLRHEPLRHNLSRADRHIVVRCLRRGSHHILCQPETQNHSCSLCHLSRHPFCCPQQKLLTAPSKFNETPVSDRTHPQRGAGTDQRYLKVQFAQGFCGTVHTCRFFSGHQGRSCRSTRVRLPYSGSTGMCLCCLHHHQIARHGLGAGFDTNETTLCSNISLLTADVWLILHELIPLDAHLVWTKPI